MSDQLALYLEVGISPQTVGVFVEGRSTGSISVGTRGAWLVEAPGVADYHAFLYFDGRTLFVGSSNPLRPVIVNDIAIRQGWCQLKPDAIINLGDARFVCARVAADVELPVAPSPRAGGPPPPVFIPISVPESSRPSSVRRSSGTMLINSGRPEALTKTTSVVSQPSPSKTAPVTASLAPGGPAQSRLARGTVESTGPGHSPQRTPDSVPLQAERERVALAATEVAPASSAPQSPTPAETAAPILLRSSKRRSGAPTSSVPPAAPGPGWRAAVGHVAQAATALEPTSARAAPELPASPPPALVALHSEPTPVPAQFPLREAAGRTPRPAAPPPRRPEIEALDFPDEARPAAFAWWTDLPWPIRLVACVVPALVLAGLVVLLRFAR